MDVASEALQAFYTILTLPDIPHQVKAWILPTHDTGSGLRDPALLEAEFGLRQVRPALPLDRRNLEAALSVALAQAPGFASGPSLDIVARNEFDARRASTDPMRGLPMPERALLETLFEGLWLPVRSSPPQFKSLEDLLRDLAGGGGATYVALATDQEAVVAVLMGAAAIVIVQFATGVGEAARAFGRSLFMPPSPKDSSSDE